MKRLILFTLLLVLIAAVSAESQTLFINEFMTKNLVTITDEKGDFEDWIEIYNAGDQPVDIGGMYITDDLSDQLCWQIPTTYPDSTTIQPGGFLILWADKESEEGILHLELKLSTDGEQIGLSKIVGADTIFVDSLTYTAQTPDTSYGRIADGGVEWGFFSTSTPGESNSGGVLVGIKDEHNPTVSDFKLLQNYPNPFNPATQIRFQLSKSNAVNITIYNLNGEKIQTLVNKPFARGSYTAEWNGTNQNGLTVSSGIYIYTMTIDNAIIQSRKMIYMK